MLLLTKGQAQHITVTHLQKYFMTALLQARIDFRSSNYNELNKLIESTLT